MDAWPDAPGETRHEITALLAELRDGRRDAMDRLISVVYGELRRIAHNQLGGEAAGHTLNTTALVHEAYFKLVGLDRIDWRDRAHFLAAASGAMRRVLIEYARRYRAAKRGSGRLAFSLDEAQVPVEQRAETLVALDEALARLAQLDERQCRVVECRFFGGLTEEETAAALGVTARTVRRDWTKARGWLYQEIGEIGELGP